ncbi:MAG: metal-dependent transcriptional regulator [Bacteroidota bacterium]
MASTTEENYLKALLSLSNEKHEVNLSVLSERLGVSKPTVNSMVKNLQQQKLVDYQKYKPLKLTENGRKMASLIIRKHRLTEMYLVEKMGFGWEEVHEIAEQVEHVKSPQFFDRMDELMDFPTVDPHGSPIPDRDGNITASNSKKLTECLPGQKVVLTALSYSSKDFLAFLDSRDISLGLSISIKSVESFDQSMVVSYDQHPAETLSQKVCTRLLVVTEK